MFLPPIRVGLENPEIIVRNVSECRSTLHITHGIDSRYIGFEKLIDADEPFGICSDTGSARLSDSKFGTRPGATSRCDPVSTRSPSGVFTVSRTLVSAALATRMASAANRISIPSSCKMEATASATSGSSRASSCLPVERP